MTDNPSTPQLLKLEDGREIRFASTLAGGLFTNAGDAVPAHVPNLDTVVADAPFRSILSLRLPAGIGFVWLAPDDQSLPIPGFILQRMFGALGSGRALLLLATNRRVRDRVKAFLTATLQIPGGRA